MVYEWPLIRTQNGFTLPNYFVLTDWQFQIHYTHIIPDPDVEDPRPTSHVPTSQFFSEGNGGEFRYIFFQMPLLN